MKQLLTILFFLFSLSANAQWDKPTCFDCDNLANNPTVSISENNGELTAVPGPNCTPPLTYLWTDPNGNNFTTQTIMPLDTGRYKVQLFCDGRCSAPEDYNYTGDVMVCGCAAQNEDTTPPTLVCNLIESRCPDIPAPYNSLAQFLADGNTATDNCSIDASSFQLTNETSTGSCPDAYTIQRTYSVADACGNITTCVQIVRMQTPICDECVLVSQQMNCGTVGNQGNFQFVYSGCSNGNINLNGQTSLSNLNWNTNGNVVSGTFTTGSGTNTLNFILSNECSNVPVNLSCTGQAACTPPNQSNLTFDTCPDNGPTTVLIAQLFPGAVGGSLNIPSPLFISGPNVVIPQGTANGNYTISFECNGTFYFATIAVVCTTCTPPTSNPVFTTTCADQSPLNLPTSISFPGASGGTFSAQAPITFNGTLFVIPQNIPNGQYEVYYNCNGTTYTSFVVISCQNCDPSIITTNCAPQDTDGNVLLTASSCCDNPIYEWWFPGGGQSLPFLYGTGASITLANFQIVRGVEIRVTCDGTTYTQTIDPNNCPCLLDASFNIVGGSIDDVTCEFDLRVSNLNYCYSNGTPPVTYLWDNGGTTQTITNQTQGGNRSVTVSCGSCSVTEELCISFMRNSYSGGGSQTTNTSPVTLELCAVGLSNLNYTATINNGGNITNHSGTLISVGGNQYTTQVPVTAGFNQIDLFTNSICGGTETDVFTVSYNPVACNEINTGSPTPQDYCLDCATNTAGSLTIPLHDLLSGEQNGGTWTLTSAPTGNTATISGTNITLNCNQPGGTYTFTYADPCGVNPTVTTSVFFTKLQPAFTIGTYVWCPTFTNSVDLWALLLQNDAGAPDDGTWSLVDIVPNNGVGGNFTVNGSCTPLNIPWTFNDNQLTIGTTPTCSPNEAIYKFQYRAVTPCGPYIAQWEVKIDLTACQN